jgi:type II secretory pathway component PulC
MKKFCLPDPRLIAIFTAAIILSYAVYCFLVMPRPKGLRIHAPGAIEGQAAAKTGNSSANLTAFSKLNPASFSAAFALDYHKTAEKPTAVVEEKKKEPEKKIEVPVEVVPDTVDLAASGYRLKGIVHEKDGNSAVFIYDPATKKTLVIRERAEGPIKIIETSPRSVRLLTPEGEGVLELDDAKSLKSGSYLPGFSAGPAVTTRLSKVNSERERALRKTETSPSGISDIINAGHFQVRRDRGSYSVQVKNVPDSFGGYGLRPGDQIIGTAQEDFKKSQDVALKLGQINVRPTQLKVRRGRRVIFLNPPAKRPATSNDQKQGNR